VHLQLATVRLGQPREGAVITPARRIHQWFVHVCVTRPDVPIHRYLLVMNVIMSRLG
jgi:hypothetical protein